MRRVARIRATFEALELLLQLPEGARIIAIDCPPFWNKTCFLAVEGPTYPEVPEGDEIPWVDHEIPRP